MKALLILMGNNNNIIRPRGKPASFESIQTAETM